MKATMAWRCRACDGFHGNTTYHGFVGYPFDYRVTLGFGSITGGLDHVNPVIRLPLERRLAWGFRIARIIGQTKDIYTDMGDDADINTLTVEQSLALIQDHNRPGIVKPEISNDVEFKINSNFIRELRLKIFTGTIDVDAHEHVRRVLEIVDLFHFPGVTHDAVMLRVFPITLKGRALSWKKRLPAGVINTWDLLEKEFIWQYCSPFKTAMKFEEIHNFKQEIDETLYHAWERYSDLIYRCLQHDLNCQQKVHIFYTRLDISTRRMLDSKGFITLMTPTQALISIQVMADHSHNWYDETTTKEQINDSPDNIDVVQESFKEAHPTKECPFRKRTK
ncbi:ribonuclease H-like domain-containing protein [Tanacetum coccineum]